VRGDDAVIEIGSRVRLRSARQGAPQQLVTIVPDDRAAGLSRLSATSVLGRALLGHRAGDRVVIRRHGLTVTFLVLGVELGTPPFTHGAAGATSPAVSLPKGPVVVGSMALVDDGERAEWWQIVPGEQEADHSRHWISEGAPLARALLGHHAGERVHVRVAGRRRALTILAVDPSEEEGLDRRPEASAAVRSGG
jgi:transcription elongation GreA/GreB family factor